MSRLYHDTTAAIINGARGAPRIIVATIVIEHALCIFFNNAKIELFKIAYHVLYLINHNFRLYSHI